MVSAVDSRLTYSETTYFNQQITMDLQETVGVLPDPGSSVLRAEFREAEAVIPAEHRTGTASTGIHGMGGFRSSSLLSQC